MGRRCASATSLHRCEGNARVSGPQFALRAVWQRAASAPLQNRRLAAHRAPLEQGQRVKMATDAEISLRPLSLRPGAGVNPFAGFAKGAGVGLKKVRLQAPGGCMRRARRRDCSFMLDGSLQPRRAAPPPDGGGA